MNLIRQYSAKTSRWIAPRASHLLLLVMLGCAAPEQKAPPSNDPNCSFAEARARIGLLTDEHILNEERYRSFWDVGYQAEMETIEALVLSVDDPRIVPSPPVSSGSEDDGKQVKWTVGHLCRVMLFRVLRTKPEGAFESTERDWHAWWEANRTRSLPEIRREIAVLDGRK